MASAVFAAPPVDISPTVDEFECGSLKVQVRSVWLTFRGEDSPASQLLEQTLTMAVANAKPQKVAVDGRYQRKKLADGRKVLDAALTSWACLQGGQSPPYLLLAYACTEGEERGSCANGVREWDRLYDQRGRHLTAGLRRQDPRRAEIDRVQGLTALMNQGVNMTGLRR